MLLIKNNTMWVIYALLTYIWLAILLLLVIGIASHIFWWVKKFFKWFFSSKWDPFLKGLIYILLIFLLSIPIHFLNN